MPSVFHNSKGDIGIYLLLGIVALSLFLVGGVGTVNNNLSTASNSSVSVDEKTTASGSANELQIQTFSGSATKIKTPGSKPGPGPVSQSSPCGKDTGQPMPPGCACPETTITCQNSGCTDVPSTVTGTGPTGSTVYGPGTCSIYVGACNPNANGGITGANGTYCIDKPVVYLYPEKPTSVSVKVSTTGKVVVSDPTYPQETGWQNILAMPDGSLIYQNKAYSELFYESNNNGKINPSKGIVVETSNIEQELYKLTAKLGLIKKEQDELVSYWTPRLQNLNKPYILISLVDQKTKEQIDSLEISPKPDTRIEFLLYFKGLDQKISIPSLDLPKAPQRTGFTEVEWGGSIDH